jgi:hyaluronan synthase
MRRRSDIWLRIFAAIYLVVVLVGILFYRSTVTHVFANPIFAIYGIIVAAYLITRYVLSLFYRAYPDAGFEPHIAIVVPGFNEEDAVAASIRSLLEVDYPEDKLEIVAVDDGSTDGTLREMCAVAEESGDRVQVISFPENRGKRRAMAAGIRATSAEIIVVVDSDSIVAKDGLRKIVQPFVNEKIGAVCGHTDVENITDNWLAKIQAVRYFIAFRVMKAAESVFRTVTCCSGCFSAYRRSAITPSLEWWEEQTFLGVMSTYGDDRSLTNCVLRHWQVVYQNTAKAHTIVPTDLYKFVRQQARWKRSWAREATYLVRLAWRKPIPAQLAIYVSCLLPLTAPIIAFRALILYPLVEGHISVLYPLGIYAMALTYGLYFAAARPTYSALWWYGFVFVGFYVAFLLWQTYWAIATLRTAKWGTRPTTAGLYNAQLSPHDHDIVVKPSRYLTPEVEPV